MKNNFENILVEVFEREDLVEVARVAVNKGKVRNVKSKAKLNIQKKNPVHKKALKKIRIARTRGPKAAAYKRYQKQYRMLNKGKKRVTRSKLATK